MSLLTRACDLLPQVLPRGLISMSGAALRQKKTPFLRGFQDAGGGTEPPTRGL